MNLNTSSGAGAGAINLKIASSGAGAGAWSILGQLPSPGYAYPEAFRMATLIGEIVREVTTGIIRVMLSPE